MMVRFTLTGLLMLLSGCGPGIVFNSSQDMSHDEMLARASHIFVGVIQKHQFDSWPWFRLNAPGVDPANAKYWKVLRREVRIEMVLRGIVSRKVVDIYEISSTGGASGDWNSTPDGERDLFLVRLENGRYHLVRDWWRSIFPVTTGSHLRLPLDQSRPMWERIALMNSWVQSSDSTARIVFPYFSYNDPGGALSDWRKVKLLRGLVRHPGAGVRVPACRELILLGRGQDECWDSMSESDKAHFSDSGYKCCSSGDIEEMRRQLESGASWWWPRFTDREERRLLTAANNPGLRTEICRLYEREYPGDRDTGCPADRPPPATMVTENGDVPLNGAWPR